MQFDRGYEFRHGFFLGRRAAAVYMLFRSALIFITRLVLFLYCK